MKLKIVVCSLVSLAIVASDDSARKIDLKNVMIEMVPFVIGGVRLERPVTPKRTMVEEMQFDKEALMQRFTAVKSGPIRRSSFSCVLTEEQELEKLEARKAQTMFEDKVKKDVYEILRQNYLKALEQVVNANLIASTTLLIAGSAKRMESD